MTSAIASRKRGRASLEVNASALMLSTVLTGVLGILFWIVAARLISPSQVGRASAALAAATFLAGLAQLNIISVFIRFVPGSGPSTASFIRRGYGIAVITGLVVASGFLGLGLAHNILGHAWFMPLAFIAVIAIYAVFFVQDGALTALNSAVWVPLENLVFGVVRVVVLIAITKLTQQWGAFIALSAPIVLAVLIVNWCIFRRLVPKHVADSTQSEPVRWADIRGFVAADYLASAVASCVALLPPVLVAALLGSEVTAYFYIPWFIGVSFGTLIWNVAMAFVAGSADDPAGIPRLVRRAIRMIAVISAAACVGAFVAAPIVLDTLGPAYSSHGVIALRIIALAFPASGLIIFYTALSLLQKTLKTLVIVQAGKAAAFLTGSALLLSNHGINSLALTYVVCEVLAALILLPKITNAYRILTSPGTRTAGTTEIDQDQTRLMLETEANKW